MFACRLVAESSLAEVSKWFKYLRDGQVFILLSSGNHIKHQTKANHVAELCLVSVLTLRRGTPLFYFCHLSRRQRIWHV